MGSKSSSAPAPDPRLIEAQIRSMGIQDDAIQQIMANANRMMPLQEEQMRFGLQTSRQAYDDSRADREFALGRRGMLATQQDRLVSDANQFDLSQRTDQLAGRATADVTSAFNNAQAQQMRGLARMGVNPNSGKFAAMGNQMTSNQALAQASAANSSRESARREGYALTDRATNALSGYPSMASGLTGQGAGFGAAGLGMANSALAGMNSGYQAGGGMAGQMGQNAATMYSAMGNYKSAQDKIENDANPMGALLGMGGQLGAAYIGKYSDRRLKTDVVQVGSDEATGLNLYEWAYINGDGRRFRGVMADEVERVMPDAVVYDDLGFASVNYAMLGIEMVEV